MATVFLARDLRHDRRVAVKVLRPELAAVIGAQRFLAEIRTTANLQHPHILPLFDSGEVDGTVFYVMPFVEGESLRQRLEREKQLPIADALRIAREVAAALDYAHRQGVVHRDIKPENILLHEGQSLVADFGIALAASTGGGKRMTETGMSLGTPAYMSPEQAMGEREVTARADIYALGCVLYEMLVGEPPFTRPTAQAIVARVLTTSPPSPSEMRRSVPPHVEAAIHTALEKLPADRFGSAAEFSAAIAEGAATGATASRPAARGRPRSRSASLLPWSVAVVATAFAAWGWLGDNGAARGDASQEEMGSSRWTLVLPDTAPLDFVPEGSLGTGRRALALSPDGSTLVYVARTRDGNRLYRRRLSDSAASPITGSDGAMLPFFSPDGAWVGFFTETELRKVPIEGGPPAVLTAVAEPAGADWAADGRILVAAREGSVLGWVNATGGELRVLPGSPEGARVEPKLIGNGDWALVRYFRLGVEGIAITELATGKMLALTVGGAVPLDSLNLAERFNGAGPRLLRTGHLLYASAGRLFAVPYRPGSWVPLGPPVEVMNDVRHEWDDMQVVVTLDGTLVYASGGQGERGVLAWADGTGALDTLPLPEALYGTFDISPDGQRVAVSAWPPGSLGEIRVLDLVSGIATRVETRGVIYMPRWWPDGRHLVFTEFAADPLTPSTVIRQLPGSIGVRDTLLRGAVVSDVSPDTADPVMAVGGLGSGMWLVRLREPDRRVAIDSFPTAWGATFSHDGRWIAYTSNQSGRYEVYVVDADLKGERMKVSLAGGEEPRWSRRGDRLVYRWGSRWFSVSLPASGARAFGQPRVVLEGPFINVGERSHDLDASGRRHLVVVGAAQQTAAQLQVVTNFLAQVRRKAPMR